MKELQYCPDHGKPGDEGGKWPCPLTDDDQMCKHFEAELARRVHDVTVNGNYVELLPDRNEAGERMLQEYRNHQPHGEPRPLGQGYH